MADRLPVAVGLGAAFLAVGFAGITWVDLANDTLRAGVVTHTITWFLVAFVGYGFLLSLQRSAHANTSWKWLLAFGLVLRLLMLVTEPTLSDDVYRYLWEGHLVTEGVSPYSFPIDSPLGDPYDIPARALANNTSLASPYLPVAHGIFGVTALVLPSEPWTMQLLMICFDMLAAAMVIKLLRLARLPERRVLLYWLNPLVVIEVAHGAHLDAMILGLASVGLWLSLDKARTAQVARTSPIAWTSQITVYAAPVLVAAATLTRPLAMLLIPVLFWIWNWRQRIVWAVAVGVPIAITGASVGFGIGGVATGTGVFGSARAYTDSFRFNSGLYHWLERWIASRGLDDRGWNEPAALTRLIVGLVAAALLLVLFLVARRDRDVRATLRLLAVPLVVYVVLTPVLHPWYTLLLLGFVPFLAPGEGEPNIGWLRVAPWILLSALLVFSYLTYEDPVAFGEREWVRRLEWYPTLALLAASLLVHVAIMARQKNGRMTG